MKKLLLIFAMATVLSIAGILTPSKYDVSVASFIGWCSCLTWLWIFPHKKTSNE